MGKRVIGAFFFVCAFDERKQRNMTTREGWRTQQVSRMPQDADYAEEGWSARLGSKLPKLVCSQTPENQHTKQTTLRKGPCPEERSR